MKPLQISKKNIQKPQSILHKQSEIITVTIARFDQLKLSELIVCMVALIGLGSALISSDLSYSSNPHKSTHLLILQIICTTSTLLLILALC